MSAKKNVVFLGNSGFPYGMAEVQKIILISKCLLLQQNDVAVFCNRGIHRRKDRPHMKAHDYFEGIEYIYTAGNPFYEEKFVKRNLLKVKGVVNEIALIGKRSRRRKLDVAILSTHKFQSVLLYYILSRVFGFKVILNYVEFSSGIKKDWYNFSLRINDSLFDRFAPSLSDGVLPISEFLKDHLKKVAPGKPYFKIPGLTDYSRFEGIEVTEGDKYFLFCGAAIYKETIYFIIDAFEALTGSRASHVYLNLVINGTASDMADVKEYISKSRRTDMIRFFTKLTDKELSTQYKNAIALLIPLRPTFQDIARFPHKIGEYLASGNPVISTDYGEVKYYFTDMGNMLIAGEYDVNKFAVKMQSVVDHPELAKQIGTEGQQKGLSLFDYQVKAPEIDQFIDKLVLKQ